MVGEGEADGGGGGGGRDVEGVGDGGEVGAGEVECVELNDAGGGHVSDVWDVRARFSLGGERTQALRIRWSRREV